MAMAIGRRISNQAISEEKKWASEKQPVLLMTDATLHYLVLKSASMDFSVESLTTFFTANHGVISKENILNLLRENTSDKKYLTKAENELKYIATA
jgi:hypothetical protein